MTDRRLCLACKGKKYIYDYSTSKFTRESCTVCDEAGTVPFESHDDGYGPFRYVQHRLTTEVQRGQNPRALVSTTDIRHPQVRADDEIVVKINTGIFTVNELLAICSMLKRLRSVEGLKPNCVCCREYKATEDGKKIYDRP
jgi:hypothetical protein